MAPSFEVVRRESPPVEAPTRRWVAGALGIALLAWAGLATWAGADHARRTVVASEIAETTLQLALEEGNDGPAVKASLTDLRREISRRPLDSKTRVAYATLWLGLSRRLEDLDVAAFHARRAAELAPVTLPVIRPAVLILGNTDRTDDAIRLVHEVFGFDAPAAARLLAAIEPLVGPTVLPQAMPATVDAAMAWRTQLLSTGRRDDAALWLEQAYLRWPDDPRLLRAMSILAVDAGDFEMLGRLFPPGRDLPDDEAFAVPILCRALLHAHLGEEAQARADLALGLELGGHQRWPQIYAGRAYWRLGELDSARRQLMRALHGLPGGADLLPTRRLLMTLVARLEEEDGRMAAALRMWESLLEVDPGNTEAAARVEAIVGFNG